MDTKNILVLFGGASPEHEISLQSAAAVIPFLSRHTVVPVYITKEGKWLLYDGKLDNIQGIDWEKYGTSAVLSPDRVNRGLLRVVGDKIKIIPIDVVFPILHGPNGEDGTIQGLCELADLPYVGCGVTASSAAMDKGIAKLIAKGLKIPQAEFLVFDEIYLRENKKEALRKIGLKIKYPCFVKPACGGSSIGVSKANNRKELIAAIETALKFHHRLVFEKAVDGREVEVGILGTGSGAKASVVGEILADGDFYDFEAKYESPASQTVVPADISKEISEKIQAYALEIFRSIDGRGLSRADFFITSEGNVLFNEINTVPGFTAISMYAKMWEAMGISRQSLVEGLVNLAVPENINE